MSDFLTTAGGSYTIGTQKQVSILKRAEDSDHLIDGCEKRDCQNDRLRTGSHLWVDWSQQSTASWSTGPLTKRPI
jgi:hypothetical protein